MTLLNFKEKYRQMIKKGKKRSSIRNLPANCINAGDKLHMYCRSDNKNPHIGSAICSQVTPILVHWKSVYVGKKKLSQRQILKLAHSEGVSRIDDFLDHYVKPSPDSHPFIGIIVQWNELNTPKKQNSVDYSAALMAKIFSFISGRSRTLDNFINYYS